MSVVAIRPYQKKDCSHVQRICLETAGARFVDTPYKKRAAVAAFCRYFIDRCPEFCFVAVDEDDIPVGYIICTPTFERWCRYVPEQFLTGFPFSIFWSLGSMLGAVPYLKAYPAHLHINLLPSYQRRGLGRQLMGALERALQEHKCPGVSLCVSKQNPGAMKFYESCGFQVLGRHPRSVAYGKKLHG